MVIDDASSRHLEMPLLDSPDEVASSLGAALRVVLAIEADSCHVEVEGAAIHYRLWDGPSDAVPVLLVHGMLAHSHWWDAVAGWLSKERKVVAMDFSGMGDSGRRACYSRAQHAREILSIAQVTGLRDAMLVAHSYGGDPAIRACRQHPNLFGELMLLDCRLMLPSVQSAAAAAGLGQLARKIYPSIEEARRRFRLLPDSTFADPVLLEHVIAHSMVSCDGGWSWKYDPAIDPEADPGDPLLTDGLKIPMTFVRGAESIATPSAHMEITRRYFPFAEIIEIPACGHHVMLDQPVGLTACLRAKLN